ncbi:hypothetical protein G7058_11645 (plasmid) [Jeotgalibaca porci]|uniref:Uncharacterized protein n=1 Tax=Jeotgalibaca porci TaxID=1868793 RepID=A0A6G7WKK4_9LACT|nr:MULTISPECIES: hypothetical protein [Jeotgalibaca]APZ49510.1 hypothetical protein BW721_07400 [Jeotgalibaca sp. PTS2502]QIK52775.1 hypothetical protein G7058_11645 [Jeotgalibaca porci]
MKRPKSEDVPNQGCGIFFLMVLTTFLLMSLPVLKTTYNHFFEKKILLVSDSPDNTYHIEVSTEGYSSEIIIKETATSSEHSAVIITDQLTYVNPEDIKIKWLNDKLAEIIVMGRDDTQNFFYFNGYSETEKIQ